MEFGSSAGSSEAGQYQKYSQLPGHTTSPTAHGQENDHAFYNSLLNQDLFSQAATAGADSSQHDPQLHAPAYRRFDTHSVHENDCFSDFDFAAWDPPALKEGTFERCEQISYDDTYMPEPSPNDYDPGFCPPTQLELDDIYDTSSMPISLDSYDMSLETGYMTIEDPHLLEPPNLAGLRISDQSSTQPFDTWASCVESSGLTGTEMGYGGELSSTSDHSRPQETVQASSSTGHPDKPKRARQSSDRSIPSRGTRDSARPDTRSSTTR